jgi:hypothetical protein
MVSYLNTSLDLLGIIKFKKPQRHGVTEKKDESRRMTDKKE